MATLVQQEPHAYLQREHHSNNKIPAALPAFYCDPVTGSFIPCRPTSATHLDLRIPADPLLWSREDVARWLQGVSVIHGLPAIQLDRFLMNGKALCLMTMDMFVHRVPLGGKLLYKDFQLRLYSALYNSRRPPT